MERVVAFAAAVEDQVLGDLDLLGGDQVQRADLGYVDDGAGHAGAHGVVEEDRVQHRAGGGVESEADVGQAEDDLDVGKLVVDHFYPLQRPLAELAVVLVAGGDGEGQRVDQQIGLRQAVLVAGEFDQPRRDFQLVGGGLGHADLVNGQGDDRGAEFLGEDQPVGGGVLAILEIDRVDDRLAAVQLQRRFEDGRFGAVDDEGGVHRGGEPSNDLVHLENLVAADEGGADVERVGALGDLVAADRDAAVPVALFLQLAPFLGAVGVAALADGEEGVFLAECHRLVERGDGGNPDRAPPHGGWAEAAAAAQHAVERLNVLDRGAAAAADQVDAVLGDKALHPARHLGGAERIVRVAVNQFGQAGVGLDGNQTAPVGGQPAHVLGHLLRTGGAVEADHRHVDRVDHRGRGANVGADEQGAGCFNGNLNEDRGVGAGLGAGDLGTVDGGLYLQCVLTGLDQDGIDATGDQAAALQGQAGFERVVGDVAESREFGAWADAAEHPALAAIGKTFRGLAGEFGGHLVEFKGAVCQIEFGEGDRGCAEGVGFDHVGAGLEIAAMDVSHHVGARQAEDVGAVFLAPVVFLDVEGKGLDARAHTAVTQQDMFMERVEKGSGHGWGPGSGVRVGDGYFRDRFRGAAGGPDA